MDIAAKTGVDLSTTGNPSEVSALNDSFVRKCELSKEQQALRDFGLLGFDAYRDWILENQLPLI